MYNASLHDMNIHDIYGIFMVFMKIPEAEISGAEECLGSESEKQ